MKKIRTLLLILLTLTLAFCLFACGGGGDDDNPCTSHTDANEDGKCDACGEKLETQKPTPTELKLIENGEPKFQIVYSKDFKSDEVFIVNKIKSALAKFEIAVDVVAESEENAKECEILIGDVNARGDKYFYDGHTLGKEGYVFKIVDSKVIINAGSTEMLAEAVEEFIEDVLGIKKETESLSSVIMSSDQQVEEIQDDYRITSLSVDGNIIKSYTIAVDKTNSYHVTAAKTLQDAIYERTGYWLKIVNRDEANNSIVFDKVSKTAVEGGFKVSTNSKKQLVIECGFDNKIEIAIENFLSDVIFAQRNDVNLKGELYKQTINVVYYKDFGAKGDGIADDFKAIKAAHEFANISGQTVKADAGKTYRIHDTRIDGAVTYIPVKTNVEWGNAKFIIDDSSLSTFDGTGMHSGWIFQVDNDYEDITVTDAAKLSPLAGVGEGTTKLDLGLGYPAMITLYNANHKVYRRIGYSSADGADQHEVILIDKDGNIDESTPFMFDYEEVTSYIVHRTDVEHVTLKGGVFTTVASNVNIYDAASGKYIGDGYFARGIRVRRPYTVVEGVDHFITGEIPLKEQTGTNCGVAYSGFFYAISTNDVLFKNCVLTGRRCYLKKSGGTMGTYDFGANGVNKIRLEGCIQSNFYMQASSDMGVTTTYKLTNGDGSVTYGVEVDNGGSKEKQPGFTVKMENGIPKITPAGGAVFSMGNNPSPAGGRICWGIGGTNYCKNMEYINSVLSRFDAHCGLLNGKVVGTTINFFAMVGKGDFLIEDCTWIAPASGAANNTILYLRDDYGSPWEGTITIKNTIASNHVDSNGTPSAFGIVFHKYQNWYFGYDCYFPNLIIDNLTFTNYADGTKIDMIYTGCAVLNQDIHLDTYNGTVNQNPVVPPEFITIKNNKKGYKYYIPDNNFFKETDFSACEEGSLVRN